jgi:N-glycosylase/DNA lyase
MKVADEKIAALASLHRERKNAIASRLQDFMRIAPSEYFYELAYCLLTPQSSAVHADNVIAQLRQRQFFELGFDPESILRQKDHYIRFHRTKARYLLEIRSRTSRASATRKRHISCATSAGTKGSQSSIDTS